MASRKAGNKASVLGTRLERTLRGWCLAAVAAAIPALAQAAAAESLLYSFNTVETPTLCNPAGPLIQASDENFYGVANSSADGEGAVYRLTPAGNLTILHDFPLRDVNGFNADGARPMSVIQGSDGKLYGTAEHGGSAGAGTVFRLGLDGSGFTVFHSFQGPTTDGAAPDAALTEGADGNFYGVATAGTDAGNNGGGTLFRVSPSGVYTPLHAFIDGTDGSFPNTRLVQAVDGNFYGTADSGGPQGSSPHGTVFQFAPGNGAVSVLNTFQNHGSAGTETTYGLVVGLDGNLYGTTSSNVGSADPSPNGTAYRLSLQGSGFAVLHSFDETGLNFTAYDFGPLVLGSDGNIYGANFYSPGSQGSSSLGDVYQLTPAGQYAVAYAFGTSGSGDGSNPRGGMVQGSDGSYYGIASGGGASANGCGAVYKLAMAPAQAPPVQISVSPASITLGQTPAQSATLSWTVANATSQTFQRCFASGGTASYSSDSAWSGVKPGATVAATQVVAPTTPGTYRYALTCGGVETSSTLLTVNSAAPVAPTVNIAVNPATITVGQSATLNWSSVNATSCSASGAWSGSQAINGNLTVAPTAAGSYTYTLACTGAGGTTSKGATLTVNAPPPTGPTVTIAANPATITLGQSSNLTWSSTNATACTASNGWSGSEPTAGTQTVTPKSTGTTTYTLTCTGTGGSATAFATVQVNPPPPTVSIAVNPTTIAPGQSATLTYSSTNATACSASGAWSGSKPTSGSQMVSPAAAGSYTYTLSCTGPGGTASASATLTVSTTPPPSPPTVTIAVNPASITLGQSATLSFSSTNAAACTASGAWSGSEPTSGSLSVAPAQSGTYTYTLSCTGAGGTASSSATLTVTPPPPTVTIAVNPPSITLGQSATLSWSSSNADSCSASGAWSGGEPTSGSLSVSPSAVGSYTYTLTCSQNAAETSVTGSATLTVSAAPVNSGITGSAGAFGPAMLLPLGLLALLRRQRRQLLRQVLRHVMRPAAPAAAVLLALGMGAAPVRADEFHFDTQHAYLGLRLGEGIYAQDTADFAGNLAAQGDSINGVSLSKHRFGGAIYGGVPVFAGLGLEAGFVQLGKYEAFVNTASGNLPKVTADVARTLRPAGQGLTLGVGGSVPVLGRLCLFSHVSMLLYTSTQEAHSAAGTFKQTRAGVGGAFSTGAQYRFSDSFYAGAGLDAYVEHGGTSVFLPNAQIEYHFGP